MFRMLFFAVSLTISCLYAEYNYDFDRMMGKGTEIFDLVQTKEDRENLGVFRKNYHRNLQVSSSKGKIRIPKTIHFIWCGPQSLSKGMLKNIYSWAQRHPDWTLKFWSDRKHRLPLPNIKLCLAEEFSWQHLEHKYKSTLNYSEREELLAYEILLQEGGVCVHPSVSCRNSFNQIHQDYDFYAFASKPHVSAASSTVLLDHSLIGSVANHPKIQRTIEHILSSWVRVEKAFPLDEDDSFEYRQIYRTRLALDKAVKERVDDTQDLIFPAGLLYKIKGKEPLLACSKHVKKPFKGEILFEEKVDNQIDSILRKEQKLLLMHLVLIGTLIAGFFVLFKKKYI